MPNWCNNSLIIEGDTLKLKEFMMVAVSKEIRRKFLMRNVSYLTQKNLEKWTRRIQISPLI